MEHDNEEKLKQSARLLFDSCNGKSVTVDDFVKAIHIVTEAMRTEITIQEALKWCIEKGYVKG